jgi:hypothetical protein
MKTGLATKLVAALLFLTMSVLAQAPESMLDQNAPDMVVTKISWRGATGSGFKPGAAFSIEVKNRSGKTVTAVNWDFYLIDKIRRNQVFDRLSFRTDDKKIEPGKTVRLTKRPDYLNSNTLSDNLSAVPQIMRVEYSDGTFWQRPSGSQD